ncbi:LuxR C-terminal-related transcriptional regulator [Phenylobacterium sp.]|uniref:LuxR C-terminal-related transcriptional regulator n=1 Tax=Phenylobacterium sp. TaxID=1871053 RepID=UPI0035AF1FEA
MSHVSILPVPVHAERRSLLPVLASIPAGVTSRQLECLYWVQEGKSATDIGAILGISGRTVEGHLIKACNNFGVRTRFQAVLKARDLGLLAPPRP